MKNLIVANWKMNPGTLIEARRIFNEIKRGLNGSRGVEVVICPPAVYLSELKKLSSGNKISFGLQNISASKNGAYTGEISASQAISSGALFSIIGHSERRKLNESDADVSSKIKMALSEGLTPIICIGEPERDEHGSYLSFLSSQLKESLSSISKKDLQDIVIVYEPVWAIGEKSAGAMSPSLIYETVLFLRKVLSDLFGKKEAFAIKMLYGGSVDERNAASILKDGGVSGFLVGRASLLPEKFLKIIKASF
jgi:triosephosphate isomerase